MAGSQQQQIADTIFSMKRRLLRADDSSDSGESETPYGNQKQSLKRKVHYSRSGDSDFLLDLRPYKKRIEHAGYQRYILQRNPPRYDPDGDLVEPGDEYEDEDDLSTVEENPYADIQLETLLAPLTSAADLPNHPSYSVAYTSKHLTNLANEAGAISRKEKTALGHAKALFTKLQGDSSFAPDALAPMVRESFQVWASGINEHAANGASKLGAHKDTQDSARLRAAPDGSCDIDMEDAGQNNGAPPRTEESNGNTEAEGHNGTYPATNGMPHDLDPQEQEEHGDRPQSQGADDASETASQQASHRMTTRARAQAASTPSPPSSPSSVINPVHPLFLFSSDSFPDRDFGLPFAEAEETRMLVMAYVQKQEEISRLATDLYYGIMHGERMRQDVFKWAKAEGHVGEMSDGEDWYDREEWGLDQDLVKGRDEEEDETAQVGKKSTRQRGRKPDKEDR